jgi:hypothetical protein
MKALAVVLCLFCAGRLATAAEDDFRSFVPQGQKMVAVDGAMETPLTGFVGDQYFLIRFASQTESGFKILRRGWGTVTEIYYSGAIDCGANGNKFEIIRMDEKSTLIVAPMGSCGAAFGEKIFTVRFDGQKGKGLNDPWGHDRGFTSFEVKKERDAKGELFDLLCLQEVYDPDDLYVVQQGRWVPANRIFLGHFDPYYKDADNVIGGKTENTAWVLGVLKACELHDDSRRIFAITKRLNFQENNPLISLIHRYEGYALLSQGQEQAALEKLKPRFSGHPRSDEAEALSLASDYYVERGDFVKAEKYLDAAKLKAKAGYDKPLGDRISRKTTVAESYLR